MRPRYILVMGTQDPNSFLVVQHITSGAYRMVGGHASEARRCFQRKSQVIRSRALARKHLAKLKAWGHDTMAFDLNTLTSIYR